MHTHDLIHEEATRSALRPRQRQRYIQSLMRPERSRRALGGVITLVGGGAFGVVAALTVPGCANILGLEDRTLADSSASSTASGSSGSGSSGSGSSRSSGSSASSSSDLDGAVDDVVDRDVRGRENDGSLTGDGAGVDGTGPEASTTCAATGACVIASGLNAPWIIAADETRVYWTEAGTSSTSDDGAVKSCPLTGCGAGPTVYAANVNLPRMLVIDATNVYWGTYDDGTGSGGIWSCPLAGCASPHAVASASQPYGMALDATYVYWVDQLDSSVHRIAKAGGPVQVIDDGTSGVHTTPQFMAVDASSVYFTDDSGGVYATAIAGAGPIRTVITNDSGQFEYPIAVDSTNLYYGANNLSATSSGAADFVYRASKTATSPAQTPIVSGLNWAFSVVLDPAAGVVYFGDFGTGLGNDGQVGHVNTDGTGIHYYGRNIAPVEWVAFSSTYFLWATYAEVDASGNFVPSSGSITRVAK